MTYRKTDYERNARLMDRFVAFLEPRTSAVICDWLIPADA